MNFDTLAVFNYYELTHFAESAQVLIYLVDSNSVVYGSVANKLSFCYFPRLLFRATPRHNPIRNPILFNRLSIRPLTHCHGLALQRQRSQGRLCLASSLSGSHLLGLYLVGPMKIFWKGCLRSIQSSFWTMKETWPPCLPSITITDRSCSYFFPHLLFYLSLDCEQIFCSIIGKQSFSLGKTSSSHQSGGGGNTFQSIYASL